MNTNAINSIQQHLKNAQIFAKYIDYELLRFCNIHCKFFKSKTLCDETFETSSNSMKWKIQSIELTIHAVSNDMINKNE